MFLFVVIFSLWASQDLGTLVSNYPLPQKLISGVSLCTACVFLSASDQTKSKHSGLLEQLRNMDQLKVFLLPTTVSMLYQLALFFLR